MARTRSVKSDFFLDSNLCKKLPLARILFEGLWIYADRRGVLEEDLEKLKLQILPYDRCNLDVLLTLLCPEQIVRYEADGRKLLWIRNFLKHQNPHPNEPSNGYPMPPKELQNREKKLQEISSNVKKLPVDTTGTALVFTGTGIGIGMGTQAGWFDSLWAKYPNKDGLKAARRHFLASVETVEDFTACQKALENYLKSERVQKGYIKNGSTWFNNWRDWVDMKPPAEIKRESEESKKQRWKDKGLSPCCGYKTFLDTDAGGITRCGACMEEVKSDPLEGKIESLKGLKEAMKSEEGET